jgi:hypothetical protein
MAQNIISLVFLYINDSALSTPCIDVVKVKKGKVPVLN